MRILFLASAILSFTTLVAQPLKPDTYTVENLELPRDFQKQVCISGMKYLNNSLYLASERCPIIFAVDPKTGEIKQTIKMQVPQMFEMEGMTSYKDNLYLISENIAAVYQVDIQTGGIIQIPTSITLPPKSKDGDGMEGIAANETNNKFYLMRERDDNMSHTQIYTFNIEKNASTGALSLKYESMIELPLENPQWRYSDICYDKENARLICLKSYAKGKSRQQFIESLEMDKDGKLLIETLKDIPVENFTDVSNTYKTHRYSMNLEGITIDANGTIFIVSDNTSGKAECDLLSKENTILLELKKK